LLGGNEAELNKTFTGDFHMTKSIATIKNSFFIAIYNKGNKTITMRDENFSSWDAAEILADKLDDEFEDNPLVVWTQVIRINVNSPNWNKENFLKALNNGHQWGK